VIETVEKTRPERISAWDPGSTVGQRRLGTHTKWSGGREAALETTGSCEELPGEDLGKEEEPKGVGAVFSNPQLRVAS